ncbi:MAG: hypothetical protein ACLQBQ_00855 [Smithella sp.]
MNVKILVSILMACTIAATLGCSSGFVSIAPTPPPKYEKLGPAKGQATGMLGFLGSAYYVFPIGLNSRDNRAYEEALESVPGATGLIDVSLQETWLWVVIGTLHIVEIQGQAIKEVKQ